MNQVKRPRRVKNDANYVKNVSIQTHIQKLLQRLEKQS